MSKTPNLFYQPGTGGSVGFATIIPRRGKSGRDDPLGKGRVHLFPDSWPSTIPQDEGLYGHVMTQQPQGPFGPTVHHQMLDGLRVAVTFNSDGTPFVQTVWATETGAEAQRGQETYTGASVKQGK